MEIKEDLKRLSVAERTELLASLDNAERDIDAGRGLSAVFTLYTPLVLSCKHLIIIRLERAKGIEPSSRFTTVNRTFIQI